VPTLRAPRPCRRSAARLCCFRHGNADFILELLEEVVEGEPARD
jgi:hypothetical protein